MLKNVFYMQASAVLVHAIRKRTDELPKRDIALALKRKALLEAYRGSGLLAVEEL